MNTNEFATFLRNLGAKINHDYDAWDIEMDYPKDQPRIFISLDKMTGRKGSIGYLHRIEQGMFRVRWDDLPNDVGVSSASAIILKNYNGPTVYKFTKAPPKPPFAHRDLFMRDLAIGDTVVAVLDKYELSVGTIIRFNKSGIAIQDFNGENRTVRGWNDSTDPRYKNISTVIKVGTEEEINDISKQAMLAVLRSSNIT